MTAGERKEIRKMFLSGGGASSAGYQIFPLRLVQGVCCSAAEVFLRKVENARGERRDLKF